MHEVTCPRCHEVFVPGPVRVTESTAVVERFNPGQPRDGDGKWTDGAGPGAAAAAVTNAAAGAAPDPPPAGDKLKLHGRIVLGPGERLVSSGKVRSHLGDDDLHFAVTNGPAGAEVRLLSDFDEDSSWDGGGETTAALNRRQVRRLRNDLAEAGEEAKALGKAAAKKDDAGQDLVDPRERGDAAVAKGTVAGSRGSVHWEVWVHDESLTDTITYVYTSSGSSYDEGANGTQLFGRGAKKLLGQLDAIDAEMGAAESADGELGMNELEDRAAGADVGRGGVRVPLAGPVTVENWGGGAHPPAADGEFSTGDGKGKEGKDGTLGYDGRAGTGHGKAGGEPKVKELQTALNRLGITDGNGKSLAVDGDLGPKTTAAVKALQKKWGLPQDGKVTPALLAKIKAEAAKKPAPKKAAAKKSSGGKATMKTHTAPAASTQSVFARKERMTGSDDTLVEARVVETDGGRVLESLDSTPAGQRRFRVQIIAYGDSKNGRRYPAPLMQQAHRMYEGAQAYDRHRTEAELKSGTITGLVGHYSDVAATETGIEATLTLLPSATHAAEVLDAAIGNPGSPHAAGISHDVRAFFRPIQAGGRRLQEATQIVGVMSADIVSHPAAGGVALRAVAGGIDPEDLPGAVPGSETAEESGVTVTNESVLAALQSLTPEQLAAAGLARAATETTTETGPDRTVENQAWLKGTVMGTMAVKAMAEAAQLDVRAVEGLLGESFTENDITAAIEAAKHVLASVERRDLAPSGTAQVVKESRDKAVEMLDATFSGDYTKGFRSFKEAFVAVTGYRPRAWGEDQNKVIMRETIGSHYDSAERASEAGTTSTWSEILGDSITRRMVSEYNQPGLSSWRKVVSSIVPINDFRTQRIERLGGYGLLPAVAEAAPYQELTTPGDEEATYRIGKRGGTENLTLEMIANDDLRAITRIPRKLGLAAALTLYRYVWDMFVNNLATSYDGVSWFHASHGNTTAALPLNQTGLTTVRRKMRQQAAYGDSVNILSLVPKLLLVPSSLEEMAHQLCTSAVAIPGTPAGPSDTPNLHKGLDYEVIDYWTDQDDWFVTADPNQVPLIEMGFYQGRETPEMWTQSDPSNGSMFNNDTLTMKIRQIYNGVVLDHRGVQRSTN